MSIYNQEDIRKLIEQYTTNLAWLLQQLHVLKEEEISSAEPTNGGGDEPEYNGMDDAI